MFPVHVTSLSQGSGPHSFSNCAAKFNKKKISPYCQPNLASWQSPALQIFELKPQIFDYSNKTKSQKNTKDGTKKTDKNSQIPRFGKIYGKLALCQKYLAIYHFF